MLLLWLAFFCPRFLGMSSVREGSSSQFVLISVLRPSKPWGIVGMYKYHTSFEMAPLLTLSHLLLVERLLQSFVLLLAALMFLLADFLFLG